MKIIIAFALGALAGIAGSNEAKADLALTQEGVAGGFALSSFVTGMPTSGFDAGPLAVAFPSQGGELVTNYVGTVYYFSTDASNQTVANASVTNAYAAYQPAGMTVSGGQVYMANQAGNAVDAVSNTGAFQRSVADIDRATGMAGNPINGHLYVSGGDGIYDVDPAIGASGRMIGGVFDGLAVSPDGRTLYAVSGGKVYAYSTGVDGAPAIALQNVFATGDSLDGVAAAAGTLAGNLFLNTNSGNVIELNTATGAQSLIAQGGSRGDFVSADPNGTLLLSQSDSILRLTPPLGATFAVPVPEPSAAAMLGGALSLLIPLRVCRRAFHLNRNTARHANRPDLSADPGLTARP